MEALLSAFGLKKAVLLAGFLGGAISGGLLPGPLSVLARPAVRAMVGGCCGLGIAAYGAMPLALWLHRPDSVEGVAIGLGLFGLSFAFKVIRAWNELDLASVINKFMGGNK